jgi:uncharacterized membrane protein YphA (DoxX/SURF4 family)
MSQAQISKSENAILWIIRIIVGVLFILSGFSKLIDPHGLEYKMAEFCSVLGWSIFKGHELLLSVSMIAFEIIAGFALLIGYRFRLFSFLLLLLTLFFTFLTAYALFSDKIQECGCFGNCVKLTNTETFWKDVVLTILILYIFIRQAFIKSIVGDGVIGTLLMLLVSAAAFGAQLWVLKHGALVDCLPYKVGNNITEQMQVQPGCVQDVIAYEYTVQRGAETIQVKDKEWATKIGADTTAKIIDTKTIVIQKGNCKAEIKDFNIIDTNGMDLTKEILQDPNTIVLFIARNINEANQENVEKLKMITDKCLAEGIKVIGCCRNNKEEAYAFKAEHKLGFDFCTLDETVCKTILRTNSGMMVLKKGTVMFKCSSPDYPTFEQLPIK